MDPRPINRCITDPDAERSGHAEPGAALDRLSRRRRAALSTHREYRQGGRERVRDLCATRPRLLNAQRLAPADPKQASLEPAGRRKIYLSGS